ncbi:AMP-binding protein [Vibrio gigantis]|uniref:AMP-binding protein n=1 Tax=Vibrio gigantis TaxID=296199 RepID=UPI003D147FB2
MTAVSSFWDFSSVEDENVIAIVSESGLEVSYGDLFCDVEKYILDNLFSHERSLVLLKVRNSYLSIVSYLACLKNKSPFIIISDDLDDELYLDMLDRYNPNLIIENGVTYKNCEFKHNIHPSIAMMLSTSGSTGSPKLVKLTYDNIISNASSIVEYLKICNNDSAITSLPMSYSYGLSIINSHLLAQGKIIVSNYSLLDSKFWELMSTHKVTSISGVPFTYQLLKKIHYNRLDTSNVRYLTQAGGALDSETLRYFSNVCSEKKQEFYVMYGQTEASPRISYLPPESLSSKLGSIGVPVPGGTMYLIDEFGTQICSPNFEGEIVYTGANVMAGYALNSSDFSTEPCINMELKTGDLGYFDSDGYFYITGRKKRFVKIFGVRVSLDSIDKWLSMNNIPAVTVSNGEIIHFVFESCSSSIVDNTIIDFVRTFKVKATSTRVSIVDKLPRHSNGKVDFKLLNPLIYK